MLFTALAVAGVWMMKRRGEKPSGLSLAASAIYMVLVSWILWTGLSRDGDEKTLAVLGLMAALAALSTWRIRARRAAA